MIERFDVNRLPAYRATEGDLHWTNNEGKSMHSSFMISDHFLASHNSFETAEYMMSMFYETIKIYLEDTEGCVND